MTRSALEPALSLAVEARDYFRRSKFALGGRSGHKEWLHFAIYGAGIDALINFSLVDDIRTRAPRGAELARITCLVRDQGWDGDVDAWPREEVIVLGGRTDVSFGDNHVRFIDGRFHIRARLRRRPVEIDVVLRPETFPSEANNIEVEDGPCINWMVLPRLSASGRIVVDGREHVLNHARAYHDHNWGYFRWGRNFAWEWGYALPKDRRCPWSLVFVRLTDRAHTTDLMQALFLWKNERQVRVFRDQQLSVHHQGLLRAEHVFKLPRVMALVSPGRTTDVPRRLVALAQSGRDWARFSFEANDVAQVIIPNDDDLGVTVINEVSGELELEGLIEGEPLDMTGRSICEFLGA
jgi:hypothetical protein